MLQISQIKENKYAIITGLSKKRFKNAEEYIEKVLEIDQSRRETQVKLDNMLAEGNAIAREVGELMKTGRKEEAENGRRRSSELKKGSQALQENLHELEQELQQNLYAIPNTAHSQVPEGVGADDNVNIYQHGDIPVLAENALPHWELIKKYDIIDFELGNKITGAGFPVYKGKGARLQRALINFFLDEASKAGYVEVQPPIVVNQESGIATGQLPDKEGQMYHIPDGDLYLIPTAEVPITNIYRDVILSPDQLPVKHAGYTPCFRREAGSWGAHVRGLNRLHQFDKVEIVQIQHPDKSYAALEEMLEHVKSLLEKLALPYRVLRLCGGDLGFASAFTYDLEVYSAAQQKWLEVSSVSNFETYQANRLKLRMKSEDKKTQLLHTLNGSALALPRIIAAILENNQTDKGIKLPEVLKNYVGFDIID